MVTPVRALRRKLTSTNRLCTFQRVCHVAMPIVVLAGLALAGCSTRYDDVPAYWPIPMKDYDNYGPGRFKTALLAHQIDQHYKGSAPGPIGVTTFVNIDDLYSSSTFGRMVGEQLMSELAMKGFDVVELRHADALQFLDTSGEFALSRDVRAIRTHRNLAAVVVGTYVVSPERVYVNARLVEPSTSLVLSAGSVEMSKTRELAKLLRGGSMPGSLERIPVKHLGYANQGNSLEMKRQQWMAEESGWNSPDAYGANARIPSASVPPAPEIQSKPLAPITNEPSEQKSTTPKVLDEAITDTVQKPDLKIGLGN